VGAHRLTAVYGGDANDTASTSAAWPMTVAPASTAVALTASASSQTFGQAVTFTATVSAANPGSGTPGGSVTFRDGSGVLGTAALDGSGVATLTPGAFTLAVGAHTIKASYGGDATHAAGSSAPLTEMVQADATTVAVQASA